jgi:hypothetical protein
VSINLQEKQILDEIWQSQAPVELPPVDLSNKNFPLNWASEPGPETLPDAVCRQIKQALGWPDWVRLYPKPIQAVAAARKHARSLGHAGGVVYVAPGTGAPLQPPKSNPGMAVLRADWSPDQLSIQTDQMDIYAAALFLLMDETGTAFRLSPNGATGFYELDPDAVLLGPALAGGLDFAALAGKGQAPEESPRMPSEKALAAVSGVLKKAAKPEFSRNISELGRLFLLGLEYFSNKAGVRDDLKWHGPNAMPRLEGRRMWAFVRLAEEEGLIMQPLILIDPTLDAEQMAKRIWARLARAAARLKVLPEGDMAPLGWRDAAESTSCHHAAQILASLEEG